MTRRSSEPGGAGSVDSVMKHAASAPESLGRSHHLESFQGDLLNRIEDEANDESVRAEESFSPAGAIKDTATYASAVAYKRSYTIDPRISARMAYWDITAGIALIFTAIVTPYEVGLLGPPTTAADGLFVLNRLVDLIFTVDMVLNFFIMYPTRVGGKHGVVWVSDQRRIAIHYLTTWFLLDVFSIAASAVDYVAVATNGSDDDVSGLKSLRVLRALRLVKMARLIRASRIVKRWETRIEFNYSAMAVMRSMGGSVIVMHWVACAWVMQAKFLPESTNEFGERIVSWLVNDGYCVHVDGLESNDDLDCLPPWDIYAAALYWSGATITSIGYGDISASPHNANEQVIATVLMLCSAIFWAQVLATFCGVLATFNPTQTQFRQQMDRLNFFMRQEGLPDEMRRRLREYFRECFLLNEAASRKDLLLQMSPALQSEVALRCNETFLRGISFIGQQASPLLLVDLALTLETSLYAPCELVPSGKLYLVQRGLALYGGKVLRRGHCWGEDVMLSSPDLKRTWCAHALNYLEVAHCTRDDLLRIMYDHPEDGKRVRMITLKTALRRFIVRSAAEYKRAIAEGNGPSRRPSLGEISLQSQLASSSTRIGEDRSEASEAQLYARIAATSKVRSRNSIGPAGIYGRRDLREIKARSA